ncbi:efflux RND transporter periplasmic adaptor subunit [Curvibacter sp. HBC28]|uniref:Efflux RND transporter periplasmic adaptor subunit n=1 Tax=Curvibacter microcysteis TaxID=3026419 RepID=A0ABT5MBI9_9BURK|nr:efflux RND transporter periplasmic adaptor subunit [Curvibacter sp. HBC28]MDD0813937.1 efflux RND transporter periplasmic adaptor subunit [Curvibacter sp. HBC28]
MNLPALSASALLGACLLALLPAQPLRAAELLALSAAQAEAAGLRTQAATPAGADEAQRNLVLQGTVVLPSQASDMVSTPLAGVVQAVLVNPGQSVAAGTPVARLLSPQLIEWQRDWLHAEAQSQLARERLQRDEQLFAEGIIAEQRLREARSQARMAQVSLDEKTQALQLAGLSARQLQQRQLDPHLTLLAPAAGTVLGLDASPGQRLEAGMPVARLARAGRLSIEVQASQQQLPWLLVGQSLQVDGCKTPARLAAITPQVSSSSQSALLRADFSGSENCLRLNQFVQLRGAAAGAPKGASALSIPAEAVVQHSGQPHVFVQRAKGYEPVAVTLAPGGGARVTVLSGLRAGDAVVVKGTAALKGVWQGLGQEEAAPPKAPASPAKAP